LPRRRAQADNQPQAGYLLNVFKALAYDADSSSRLMT
jgi:hypothetical protein